MVDPTPVPHPRPADGAGVLGDPARLEDIAATGVLRGQHLDAVFQSATRVASHVLGASVALVSVITDDRQVFAGEHGLQAPPELQGQTPLSHSFCKHVVVDDAPLVVTDANEDPRVTGNLAIEELGVVSYLGVPVHAASGRTLGAFCVIDRAPRVWDDDELEVLRELARGVERELQLRVALESARTRQAWLDHVTTSLLHDVREPLATIQRAAETLLLGPEEVDAGVREDAVAATSLEVRRLTGMLEAMAQRHRGDEPTRAEAVVTARDVVDARTLGRHRGRVDLEIQVAVDQAVAVAAEPFASLLTNLVDNALQHTAGRVQVRLRADEGGVDLQVVDQGPGFEVDEVAVGPSEPAGAIRPGETAAPLGLRIVRGRVEELGGAIRFDSGPDRGTTVSVWVPAADR